MWFGWTTSSVPSLLGGACVWGELPLTREIKQAFRMTFQPPVLQAPCSCLSCSLQHHTLRSPFTLEHVHSKRTQHPKTTRAMLFQAILIPLTTPQPVPLKVIMVYKYTRLPGLECQCCLSPLGLIITSFTSRFLSKNWKSLRFPRTLLPCPKKHLPSSHYSHHPISF